MQAFKLVNMIGRQRLAHGFIGLLVTATLAGCSINFTSSSNEESTPNVKSSSNEESTPKQNFQACEVFFEAYELGKFNLDENPTQLADMDVLIEKNSQFDTSLALKISRWLPWWKDVLIAEAAQEEWPPRVVDDGLIWDGCMSVFGIEAE